jgi:exopolysaccharide biosynthesis polyprenyl glycosylphosphotransferase
MTLHNEIGTATKLFQYFFRLVDVVALEAAYYLSYLTVPLVRGALFPDERVAFGEEIIFSTALLIPLVWLVVLQVRELYGDPARIPYSQIFTRLVQTTLLGLGIVALVFFAFKQAELSRLLFFIFGVYSFLVLVLVRVAEKLYFVHQHRTGYYSERLLVVGQAEDVRTIQRTIADLDLLKDYAIVGYFDTCSCAEDMQTNESHLGKIQNLRQEIATRQVSEVLVVWAPETPELDFILDTCREMGTRLRIIPALALDYAPAALSIVVTRTESFWGLPSIVLSTVKWKPEQAFLKRLMDVAIPAVLLVLLSPLLLLIAVAVKLSSPGLILYRWRVLGRNNREFVGYKFRTMAVNADSLKTSLLAQNEMQGPVFKMTNDPRVTPLGRILRKYSLDELPQLWSVLKGDMSLVGPRPVFPSEFERFQFWQMRKLSVRPGITCLWQVNGRNTIADFDEWIRLDLKYIDNWSLWLDLKILAQTALVVIKGTGH